MNYENTLGKAHFDYQKALNNLADLYRNRRKFQEAEALYQEAAIEFVHFKKKFPAAADSVMYAAIVLRPGWESPRWVPLFEEKQLEDLLETEPGKQVQDLNQLYISPRLHELLWQPLEEVLGFPSEGGGWLCTIYFSPSGLLYRLNLGAVVNSSGGRVSDKFKLVQPGSTRQSAGVRGQSGWGNLQAAIFGGIRYEADSAAISQANAGIPGGEEAVGGMRGGLHFSQTDSLLRGGDWKYLKWTEVEALAVEKLLKINGLKPTLRKGFAATEEAFKAIGNPSPRILHLATHGFFFPEPTPQPPKGGAGAGSGAGSEPVFKLSEHPMIRSGLILAGGNYAWRSGKPLKPGMEDGILTACEISQMNLLNTELVVLSACETGVGEIQGNEADGSFSPPVCTGSSSWCILKTAAAAAFRRTSA